MHNRPYKSDVEVEQVVHRLECCDFALDEFTHAAHLTVAAAYLSSYGEDSAMDHMRESLLRFSRHHGRMGYHETITRFWLRMIAAQPVCPQPLYERVNEVISRFADKDLVFQYYSRERLLSDVAKREWVEPEKSPFPVIT